MRMPSSVSIASQIKLVRLIELLFLLSILALLIVTSPQAKAAPTCGFAAAVVQDSPLVWYNFNYDNSPTNYGSAQVNGWLVGLEPTYTVASQCSSYAHFYAGGGRYISTTGLPNGTFNDQQFSIEAIVRINRQTDVTYPTIFRVISPTSNSVLILRVRTDGANHGKVEFAAFNPSEAGFYSPSPIDDGQWHHLVVTMGSNRMSLYIDGQMDFQRNLPVNFGTSLNLDNSPRYTGGSDRPEETFVGDIDELLIYNQVLSPSAINSHFASFRSTSQSITSQPVLTVSPEPTTATTVATSTSGIANLGGNSPANPFSSKGTLAAITSPTTNSNVKTGFPIKIEFSPFNLSDECSNITAVGYRIDGGKNPAIPPVTRQLTLSQMSNRTIFQIDFWIETLAWDPGKHTVTPFIVDSCFRTIAEGFGITGIDVIEQPYVELTTTQPLNGDIIKSSFTTKVELSGTQAQTVIAYAIDIVNETGWTSTPITNLRSDPRIDLFSENKDPLSLKLIQFAKSHPISYAVSQISSGQSFSWQIVPTKWTSGVKTIRVTCLDFAGRQYSAEVSIRIPSATTAAISLLTPNQQSGIANFEATATVDEISKVKTLGVEILIDSDSEVALGDEATEVISPLFFGQLKPGKTLLQRAYDISDLRSLKFSVDTARLSNGKHTISVVFIDSADRRIGASTSITTMNELPFVEIKKLPSSDLLAPQTLALHVETAPNTSARLSTISLTLNGNPFYSYPGIRANFDSTLIGSNYKVERQSSLDLTWTIDASKWAEGDYTLKVSTTDTNGRVSLALTKSFNLFNSAERARLIGLKGQIDEVFQSSGGIDELSITLQDLLDQATVKSKSIRNITNQGAANIIEVASLSGIVAARQSAIDTLERKTYKFLLPLMTNCATANSLSNKLRASIETSRQGITLLKAKNDAAIAESANLSRFATAIGKLGGDAQQMPDVPIPPKTFSDATQSALITAQQFQKELAKRVVLAKKYLADLTTYQDQAQASLDKLREIQASAQRIRESVKQTNGAQSTFSASIRKEQSYLQICEAIQKVAKKGKSKVPPVKIEAPSDPITTIYCTNGTITNPIRGINPTCPDGFSKENS